MAEFLYRTRSNSSPKDKPRVYFTCHPEDFNKFFDKVCDDVFKTHDCVIYYTADMTAEISEDEKDTDIDRMNLFVVPVTFKLLNQENRAMNVDIAFAKEKNIPILPFMMESGIDSVYSLEKNFGERQYINPFSHDLTEVPYEEKLKKYLESVLISDEMAKRIRAAFDAYIFLSYRKKDRKYANELMKLIHSKPEFRDIAIWFDEFLTPGESFKENIDRMLRDSKLFTLLVTPNLLEDPNYVMTNEYPMAKDRGMDILPAEMEETDKAVLGEKYEGIPQCVDPHDDEAFRERLKESLSKIAISENNEDPEHNFLIGLAYLEGIDVEVNREKGLELVTMAGEAELPEAMEKLYDMYYNGQYVALDYKEAVYWAEKNYDYRKRTLGEEHPETLSLFNNLAVAYNAIGNYKKALEINEKVYTLRCNVLGEEHPDTLISLSNLASTYGDLGNYKKALKMDERVYDLHCKVLGEEHPETLISVSNLSNTYEKLGYYKEALELNVKVYALSCQVLGEEHPDTLISLNNLATTYSRLGDYKKAFELIEKVYNIRCKVLGKEHPDTLISLSNLASTYRDFGDHKKALELNEKVYTLGCKVLGEEHPDTLTSLGNLAVTYRDLGDYKKDFELTEKVYNISCKVLGEEHPDTLMSLNNLATTYSSLGDYKKALELNEKVYALSCKVLGEEHPDTLISLSNLAGTYGELSKYRKARGLYDQAYKSHCSVLGEDHPNTISSLRNLATAYWNLGDPIRAKALFEKSYRLYCSTLGEDHPTTLEVKEILKLFKKRR